MFDSMWWLHWKGAYVPIKPMSTVLLGILLIILLFVWAYLGRKRDSS